MKHAHCMRYLMDPIDNYKRVEEDQTQGKGRAKAFPERRDPWGGGILGEEDITITVQGEIFPTRHPQWVLKWEAEAILATACRGYARTYSGVMYVVSGLDLENKSHALKKAKVVAMPTLGFLDKDKEGTFTPDDDALVVAIRIGGYDVKRVLVD
ncbi:uncharacterized protein LOC142624826 [Castanea sativa]|uniref:uncharacterized protein LOC142624826 n=1 Tax=Castanea sativa TaxID=21020 RepID=UPI003F64CFEE